MSTDFIIRSAGARRRRQQCISHHPREAYRSACRGLLRGFCAIMLLLGLASPAAYGQPSSSFRIGFSTSTIGDVNQNDVIASVRVWSQVIAKEFKVPVDPQPVVLRHIAEIKTALTNKTVDCVNLSTNEYATVRGLLAEDRVVVGVISDSIADEYVLLVHRGSGIDKLEDLRGRRFGMLQTVRTSLAPFWLDTLLARKGLGRAAGFFGSMVTTGKVGKAVLPVFFRQVDACLVTRKGFDIMVELNPQIGQQLKVLATSPAVVPEAFFFRADYTSPIRDHIEAEIKEWHLSAAGRQVLTIFNTDRLAVRPVSCLDSAMKMLAEYERLTGNTAIGRSPVTFGKATTAEK
jgi:ABC-type phosphate/phosphonate transport system substrate-binding protein